MVLSRGRRTVHGEGADAYKVCSCGRRFPVERDARGQITSRVLCQACRELRQRSGWRRAGDLAHLPVDVPRCADCQAIVGLRYGSSVTHVNAAGLCPACARWAAKRGAARPASGGRRRPPAPPWPPGPGQLSPASWALVSEVVEALAAENGVAPTLIVGRCRTQEIAALRHGIWRALRLAGWGADEIGTAFGRHRKTVEWALRRTDADTLAAADLAARILRAAA